MHYRLKNPTIQNAEFLRKEQELIQHLEKFNKKGILKNDFKFHKDKLVFAGGYADGVA